jgi:hypothetical protein
MTTKFKLRLLLTIVITFTFACKKESSNPPQTIPSKMELLTANVWIYDSAYSNWGQPNQKVIYVRNSQSNQVDVSQNRIKFYRDGTFNEILAATGTLREGPDFWSMNSDSTVLNTDGGGYSNSSKIISLTSTKFVWIDLSNNTRGVNIPKY